MTSKYLPIRVPVSFSESAIAQTILRIVDVAANDFRADDYG